MPPWNDRDAYALYNVPTLHLYSRRSVQSTRDAALLWWLLRRRRDGNVVVTRLYLRGMMAAVSVAKRSSFRV